MRSAVWWARLGAGAATVAAGVVSIVATAAEIDHSPHVPPGYRLEWHDEFDQPLDTERWTVFHMQPRRDWITPSRRAVGHEAGHLLLTAMEENREVMTGWISTAMTYRRTYGYFECRMRLPAAPGLRAAFWLMSPTLGRAPDRPDLSGAEIHICSATVADQRDRMLSQGVYWNAYEGLPFFTTNREGTVRLLSNAPPQRFSASMVDPGFAASTNTIADDYHTFGLLWAERYYVFSVDGRETFRTARGVSRVPQFLCLSILPDPRQRARPIRLTLPAVMRVDYVRVYAPPDGPASNAPPSTAAPAAP